MVTGPSFKLGIVDPDSVSRAGIRWILREKEQQVLKLVLRGFSNGHVAAALSISERTVRYHLANICNKLGASSRTQVILQALTGNRRN